MKQVARHIEWRRPQYWLTVLILSLFMVGCAGTASILRTGDPALIYDKAMEFYQKEKWSRASDLFEGVHSYYQGTPREDSILFYNAHCKYKDRDYETAVELLDQFRRRFGRSVFIEDAEGMHAMCYYYLSPGPKRDQTITSQAIIAITEFISHYPDSDRTPKFREISKELTERLHEKAYLNAYTYYKIGRHKSAIVALKNALKQYPDSRFREEIMYLIVASSYELAHNSIASKQADRYLSMMDSYVTFKFEFPESKHLRELDRYAREANNFRDRMQAADEASAE
uniref:outer membrane protein assembly factor BamD n=1 Tax=Alistipes sp. TaxID=1872444 RepID=UPI00405603DE